MVNVNVNINVAYLHLFIILSWINVYEKSMVSLIHDI